MSRGALAEGEGIQGLTAPLLAAGARAVVATGWRVGDRSTVRLVDDFYRALAAGHGAADALRTAKLHAIRRGAPPVEWAAFTLVGDPLVTVALRQPGPRPQRMGWLVVGALLAALGGAALVYRVRRARR